MAREQIGMAIDNLNKITDQTTLEIQTAQVALQQALGQVNLCTASLDKAYENEQKALENTMKAKSLYWKSSMHKPIIRQHNSITYRLKPLPNTAIPIC